MAIVSKESLETLRQRVDLVDVLSSHLDLKRSGASYKGLCPFHDEKSPSFMIQKGDHHYHCFGCGAHGDAIQFLMTHLKMSFMDAVESLAQRFHVTLDYVEGTEEKKGPSKSSLKEALEHACRFYHFALLHTPEGHAALKYLYSRGLDLAFVRQFQIGLAPKAAGVFRTAMHAKKIPDAIMAEAGLLAPGKEGGWRDFFYDRITFPIRDAAGAVIGFSARKYKEETFGGKYVNTPETPLFKKSRVLFGLNYCRRRIAKERKAIIVEGQIDALRLIQEGFTITVAGQGTAFGEGHVKELTTLGVNEAYLALDSDNAGLEAAAKIGNLFQKEGVEVRVIRMPQGSDPDSFLRENGPEAFLKLMEGSIDYLTFLVGHLSRHLNIDSPAGKNELIQVVTKQIREWNHPLMVHESLRKLAHLAHVPENMIGVGQEHIPNLLIKKSANIGVQTVDPDRVMESDVLRLMLLLGETGPAAISLAKDNLTSDAFHIPVCRLLYATYLEHMEKQQPLDLISLAIAMDSGEGQTFLNELMEKKVNKERAAEHFAAAIQRILDRNWMEEREEIKMKLQSGDCSDDEAIVLMKQFDALRKAQPTVKGGNGETASRVL